MLRLTKDGRRSGQPRVAIAATPTWTSSTRRGRLRPQHCARLEIFGAPPYSPRIFTNLRIAIL